MSRLSFAGLYLSLHSLQGIVIPFFPVWLASRGLSGDDIAVLLSITFICKIVSNPIAAHVADVSGRTTGLIGGLLAFALVMYVGYWLAPDRSTVIAIAVALGFALPPVYPLLDRIVLGDGRSAGGTFGRVRLWGSIGFATTTFATGLAVASTGPSLILLGMFIFLAAAAIVVAANLVLGRSQATRPAVGTAPLLLLLRQRNLVLVLVGAALIQASNGFYYSLSSIAWQANGLKPSTIGLLWIVGIGAEIACFFFAERILQRVTGRHLMIAAALTSAVRWSIMGSTTDLYLLLVAQLLQAFTIAGNVSGLMQSISDLADSTYRATAVAFYTTLAMGIFISGSIWLGRQFYAVSPLHGFYPMAALCLIAAPVIFIAGIPLSARRSVPGGV